MKHLEVRDVTQANKHLVVYFELSPQPRSKYLSKTIKVSCSNQNIALLLISSLHKQTCARIAYMKSFRATGRMCSVRVPAPPSSYTRSAVPCRNARIKTLLFPNTCGLLGSLLNLRSLFFDPAQEDDKNLERTAVSGHCFNGAALKKNAELNQDKPNGRISSAMRKGG